MRFKNFKDFRVDEASLQGNPGVPEEFLRQAREDAGRMMAEFQRNHPQDLARFMSNVGEAQRLQAPYLDELEGLSEEVIRLYYGSILDNVELDIKFDIAGREIGRMMEEVPEREREQRGDEDADDDDDNDEDEGVEGNQDGQGGEKVFKRLEDEETIRQIHKRKILKNITQGEGKNSKRLLAMPEVVDRLKEIMGDRIGQRYADLLLKITDTASFFDWSIPQEAQMEMWTRNKGGFAGAVKVDWYKEEKEKDEKEQKDISDDDLIASILGELEERDEIPEETEELFNQYTPKIKVRAKDFAMLIHETIKGIYNLIISIAIPEDASMAEDVIMNTDTLADELEDLRYGPVFAAKLRDFINEFPESNEIENLREHVVGKLSAMESEDFLSLMLSFLNGEAIAKKKMQRIINEIKSDFGDYERAVSEPDYMEDPYGYDEDENNQIPDEDGTIEAPEGFEEKYPEGEMDPSKMDTIELRKAIDQALDMQDYEEARRLSSYLKESKSNIYKFDRTKRKNR